MDAAEIRAVTKAIQKLTALTATVTNEVVSAVEVAESSAAVFREWAKLFEYHI
jgi:hypothetical protein